MDMQSSALDSGVTHIRLHGRLDAPGADRIGLHFSAAAGAGTGQVVVDMSGVVFIASMGIRLLISSARNARAKHGLMVLYGASDLVQDVLEQMAIDQIMPIVATEAQALERVQAAA